ncbi:GNAT family N-acetyltransferase [Viridibacillus sp. YIM B01967]|uniref:GNAT family N-acetyltransferase n=1 Tax=Viridibacillus soli TaxID=2798301 RepID=A0ABS1HAF3_9BACL|nr:GNAT family N-acetyltransferase [Viridibacillus soli]
MIGISSKIIQPSIRELLSYATSIEKVDQAYIMYIESHNQSLFGYKNGKEDISGCIGVEIKANNCEIRHIAVSPEERGKGIGGKMIEFIIDKYSLTNITAETDKDAVEFYRNLGFKITSLGEKYPGIERFLCERIIEITHLSNQRIDD